MYQVSLKLRPNNQITLTQGQYKSLHRDVYLTASQSKPDSLKLRRALVSVQKNKQIGLRSDMKPYQRVGAKKWRLTSNRFFSLDITEKSQDLRETSSRSGFGLLPKPKNFTSASGQKLRECGAAVDHVQPSLRKIHCVTLTLPCGTDESFRTIAAWSGWLVNQLFQPIRDKYGESCLWFFVWEYQKRGAPHLHIAVSHNEIGEAKKIGDKLIKDWIKLLHRLTDISGVCLFTSKRGDRCTLPKFWQNDNQTMKKGLGRYFSKYAGKQESKQSWYCKKYPVSRFWGCCYALKKIIKEMSLTLKVNFESLSDMDEYATDLLNKILALCKVSHCEQYQFQINLGSETNPHIVADGERTVIYIFPDMLKALKSCLSQVPSYF